MSTVFVFTLVIAYVTAYLPPYIHPCGRKDPNYDQCIKSNIVDLKDKICTGMPELNILPLEPLIIDNLAIFDDNNFKANIKDIKLYGFCDFVINSVNTDHDRNRFNLDLNFNHLYLNSTYDYDVRLLTQIAHKGIIQISLDNTGIKIELDFKTITKNGIKYSYASKINNNIDFRDFSFKIDESKKELADLHKITKDIVITNKKDIIRKVKPLIEKEISENIILTLNDVFQRTNYEELFPEKIRIV